MKKIIKKTFKVIGIILSIIILVGGIIALWVYSAISRSNSIDSDSFLELRFPNSITETATKKSKFETLVLGESPPISLQESIDLIERASNDDNIRGLSIDGKAELRHNTALEIAEAIKRFKEKSSKPVYAYGDYYTQSGYILAAHADSIFLNPSGEINLKGYAAVLTYYKGLLEKLGIEMEIYVAGKYKSYVESYTRNESSPQNRYQYETYLQGLHEELKQQIARNRNLPEDLIESTIQTNNTAFSDEALKLGYVDKLLFKTDYLNTLKKKYDKENSPLISLDKYKNHIEFFDKKKGKANVAFVVVEGEITENSSNASSLNLRKTFQDIRDNKEIKTILLRVNSPGGSAFASEEIWHEIELTKAAGIEVISSISNVAGSGGYYVIANSDKIFSYPGSLTGSIGAFIAFPVLKEAFSKNLGVRFDEIKTSPFSTGNSPFVGLSEPQKNKLKETTEVLYDKFLTRISDGRKLNKTYVDSIAQGRVYLGSDALEIGLVDSLIGLYDVIQYIKKKNNLEEIVFDYYPKLEKQLFPSLPIELVFMKNLGISREQAIEIKEQFTWLETLGERPTVYTRMDEFQESY